MTDLRIAGDPLKANVLHGPVTLSTRYPGGDHELSWSCPLLGGERPPVLQNANALVEAYASGVVVWSGELQEPDWTAGKFTAAGLSRMAETEPAFTVALDSTNRVDVAVLSAIARGWRVTYATTNPVGVPNAVVQAVPAGLSTVKALLDAKATELSQRWTVRADRVLRFETDPTVPRWHLAPGVLELGQSNENYRSVIYVRYVSDTVGNPRSTAQFPAVPSAAYGYVPEAVDATGLGPISTAKALGLATGIFSQSRARLGWTSQITVTDSQLLTAGGMPADLSQVRAGDLMRAFSYYDDNLILGGRNYLDLVIGETQFTEGESSVSLSPVDAVASSFTDIVEAALRRARSAA